MLVCGHTFDINSMPKSFKPLLSNDLGLFDPPGDWRVRPYAAARNVVKSTCFLLPARFAFCKLMCKLVFFFCFACFAETEVELCKVDKHFTLVPADLAGSLIDKFFQGSLSGRGWPNGSLTVLEPNAEYSYMGLEAISRCCKYIGLVQNIWVSRQISKELYAG